MNQKEYCENNIEKIKEKKNKDLKTQDKNIKMKMNNP